MCALSDFSINLDSATISSSGAAMRTVHTVIRQGGRKQSRSGWSVREAIIEQSYFVKRNSM